MIYGDGVMTLVNFPQTDQSMTQKTMRVHVFTEHPFAILRVTISNCITSILICTTEMTDARRYGKSYPQMWSGM
jgi:hypothetical protein